MILHHSSVAVCTYCTFVVPLPPARKQNFLIPMSHMAQEQGEKTVIGCSEQQCPWKASWGGQSLHAIPQAAVYHYSSLFSLHQTPRIPKLHRRAVNDEGEDCKVVWDRNQPSESHWVRCDKSVLSHLTVGADGLTTWLNKTTICCSRFFFF